MKENNMYISRDLSWMDFNDRVLHLSTRDDIPFNERFKFLGISSNNLDEFIRVRMTTLFNYKDGVGISGLTHEKELQKLLGLVESFKDKQHDIYIQLKHEAEALGIKISDYSDLDDITKLKADNYFTTNIFPSLSPINYESTKAIPLVKSGELNFIVECSSDTTDEPVITFVPINTNIISRVVKISNTLVLIDDLILNNIDRLFNTKSIVYKGIFRIIREGDIEVELNKDIYLVDRMKDTLQKREFADPIYVEVSKDMPKRNIKILKKAFNVKSKYIYKANIMDYRFCMGLVNIKGESYKPYRPYIPDELLGEDDLFSAIRENDLLLHHPYESYSPVIKLLEQAAIDKNVLVIRQTLYRVSSIHSPIVTALCTAARNGKQVSVLLELRARFDEAQNIELIDQLEKAGCQITYGLEDYKTHCKMISIVRKNKSGIEIFSHIGTGNYNDKTSKLYTDVSYFTNNRKIGEDIINIFNFISGFTIPNDPSSKRIFYSPNSLRTQLNNMIDNEIFNIKHGNPARIVIKCNSLSDKYIIDKLYEASEAGVQIYIICRGVCSMKPINGNIHIKSIVGRYLEHSRIYQFYNNGKDNIFISSADLLNRNLDKRVELMVEIKSKQARNKLKYIIGFNITDTQNSFEMIQDGTFIVPETNIKNNINIFNGLIDYHNPLNIK